MAIYIFGEHFTEKRVGSSLHKIHPIKKDAPLSVVQDATNRIQIGRISDFWRIFLYEHYNVYTQNLPK